MPSKAAPDVPLVLRRAEPADRPAILELLRASLGQAVEHHEELFRWKHEENPFGPSPQWVATAEGRIVGFRTFMRWQFRQGDEILNAVRAVDTATHPEFQGRGIFRDLTMLALEELEAEGIDFVFNTPNDQSRPGYLKMGWQEVGRLPVAVRARSPFALVRMARSRVPAERRSLPTVAGVPAAFALEDAAAVEDLLASQPSSASVMTDRTVAFLRWRYAGCEPVSYRAIEAGGGLLLFRLRGRGIAIEAVIGDVLAPGGEPARAQQLFSAAVHRSGTDYAIRIGRPVLRAGYVPVPGNGPVLTQRPLRGGVMTPMHEWGLAMGDVELF